MNWRYVLIAAGVLVALVTGAGVLYPETAQSFVWQHFTGPIYADAMNQQSITRDGVTAIRGYTYVNEFVYALLIVAACIGMYYWLDSRDLELGDGFVYSFVPFIVFGGLVRVVEDAAILPFAGRVFIVSPIGYFLVLALAAFSLAIGFRLEEQDIVSSQRFVAATGSVLAVLCIVLLAVDEAVIAGSLLVPLLGIPVVATAVIYGLVRLIRRKVSSSSFAASGTGMVAAVGHTLDGAVTAASISFLGYGEKHPLSQLVMDMTGSPFGFLVVKMALILGIIVYIPRDRDRLFNTLIMIGIIAVGLGPAVRSFTRALFGV